MTGENIRHAKVPVCFLCLIIQLLFLKDKVPVTKTRELTHKPSLNPYSSPESFKEILDYMYVCICVYINMHICIRTQSRCSYICLCDHFLIKESSWSKGVHFSSSHFQESVGPYMTSYTEETKIDYFPFLPWYPDVLLTFSAEAWTHLLSVYFT